MASASKRAARMQTLHMVHASLRAPLLVLPTYGDCTALQDNYVLDQIRAKDLIVLQNYPQPVVHPPQKPAPPWTTTPHAPHGHAHRLAPVSSAAASEPASSTHRQLRPRPVSISCTQQFEWLWAEKTLC